MNTPPSESEVLTLARHIHKLVHVQCHRVPTFLLSLSQVSRRSLHLTAPCLHGRLTGSICPIIPTRMGPNAFLRNIFSLPLDSSYSLKTCYSLKTSFSLFFRYSFFRFRTRHIKCHPLYCQTLSIYMLNFPAPQTVAAYQAPRRSTALLACILMLHYMQMMSHSVAFSRCSLHLENGTPAATLPTLLGTCSFVSSTKHTHLAISI
jgi:hypothetical protein